MYVNQLIMKKLLLLLSVVSALFMVSCNTITYGNGSGTGSTLVGTTWTGADSYGAVITITFTDAVNGTGNVMYNGAPYATLKFTYAMKDVSNGSGAIIETTTAGKTEVHSFSFIFINNELYVTAPGYFEGTIKFTSSGGQNGGGNNGGTTNSLVGTTWKWMEDEDDEFVIITFTSASAGTAIEYDGGKIDMTFSFTYSMTSTTTGSGTMSAKDYYGNVSNLPFSFVISGNNMVFTGQNPAGEQLFTYIFIKQ